MAKKVKDNTDASVIHNEIAEKEPIKVEGFTEVPKKEITPEPSIKLLPGEVLVAELDEDGNEGATFVTNKNAFNAHFSNPKKFVLKKK